MYLYDFITGIVRFNIKGTRFEHIINRLRNEIPMRDIKIRANQELEFTTGYRYIKNVENVLEQFDYEFTVLFSRGVPALFDRYKKRGGMWLGVAASVISVIFATGFVWDVRVSGNNYVTDKEITALLSSLNVGEGKRIDKNILEDVYNRFLIKDSRISWISVNYDGTVANVEVKETKIVPEKTDRDKNINIVAACDGVIRRIDAFDGTKEVTVGEAVVEGQLLISSFNETRKNGTYMKAARGNVWATTVHNYEIYVKKSKISKNEHTYENRINRITVMGIDIPVYSVKSKNNKYTDVSYVNKHIKLFGSFSLPVKTEIKRKGTFKTEEYDADYEEAKNLAENELQYRIKKDLSGADITEKNMSYYEEGEGYKFIYQLMCIENIAHLREFEFVE